MVEIESLAAQGGNEKPAVCETATLMGACSLFGYCQDKGKLGALIGEPGLGKSTAARHFVGQAPGRYLAVMSPAASALVPCLKRVAEAVRAYPVGTGAGDYAEAIRGRLTFQTDIPLVIVDEVHLLSDQSMEELRSLWDAVRMGLVLVGSPELKKRWSGKRWAQLTSRLSIRIDLDEPDPTDIEKICDHHGVEGERARKRLGDVADLPGALREVMEVIAVAGEFAKGGPIKLNHINAAVRARGLNLPE